MKQTTNKFEKAVRLIEYLLRLSSLRTRLIREITDYEKVLWLSEIPQQKGCFTVAWGNDEEYDSDIWVEIQNRKEPGLPVVPEICEDWINKSSLRNKTEIPEILNEIPKLVKNPVWHEGSDQPDFISHIIQLKNHSEVRKAWDSYLNDKWISWTQEHNEWEAMHQIYSSLFAIHQEQLRLGEEYELVLGIGLLTYQSKCGLRVCRHLIVANVMLEFESRLGKFTIKPNQDGANIRPELDMLDVEEQPVRAEELAKSKLKEMGDNPWDIDLTEGVLKAIVHSIDSKGEYHGDIKRNNFRATNKPIVEYAPAIILRKRSSKGLSETLRRIKENIENGGEIPSGFKDLAEITTNSEESILENDNVYTPNLDGEVFFPKAYNAEQYKIVEKLNKANGVLVQGPPGTGKSHTIANLICHLLAKGQRILITAKTPRALQVIENLLPEEIRPLSINLLGSGLDEKRSLETSVNGILRKSDDWHELFASNELRNYTNEIRNLKEEKAELEKKLRLIRESEIHHHTVVKEKYFGTAAQIAQAVETNKNKFCWFTDNVQLDKPCPTTAAIFKNALAILCNLTEDKKRELSLQLINNLHLPEKFEELINSERKSIQDERYTEQISDLEFADSLGVLVQREMDKLLSQLAPILPLINRFF